ncbi:transposase [Azospirillaceae bacterium]
MRRDHRYLNAYIFGAICPSRDISVSLVMPYVNTEAMNLHLIEISRAVDANAHAIVIIDGARWHTSHDLNIPDNISTLILPPYSPELNPQENIWQYIRQNYLAGRVYNTYEDIVEACCNAWNALSSQIGRIASIASYGQTQCKVS